jgi:N-acetylglucosaminyl-diphospho-decaprenol L-rhamnosyltransferase
MENSTGHDAAHGFVIVSVVGFRNPDDLRKCLTALVKSEHKDFIVSICENGGPAAFDSLVQSLSGVALAAGDNPPIGDPRIDRIWSGALFGDNQPVYVLRAKSNLGFAGGVNATVNQLLEDPRWTAVWLLNPDAEPDPRALLALWRRQRETGAAIVGGRLVFQDTDLIQLYGGRWRPLMARGFNIGLGSAKDAPVDVDKIERSMTHVNGASMFVSRTFVETVGMMPEDYFLYAEEVDWCLRAESSQLRYAHDCVVYHRFGTTIGSSRDRGKGSDLSLYLEERNKLLLSRRFYPKLYPIIVIVTLTLLSQFIFKGATRKIPIAFRGWMAGLRGERGPPEFLIEQL